jgi:Gamma-glutamyl cyclotransferase, AIG2-like
MILHGHAFVFGYGSLAALADGMVASRTPRATGFVCDLRGYRRQWGVAMDNRRDLPGYKHYTDAAGHRLAVFVCFLDIEADARGSVNGLCVPVDDARLTELDARERNYDRIDVSDLVDAEGARVWTYVGARPSRLRMRWAVAAHRAVIDAGYLDTVTNGFQALGEGERARCAQSLAPGLLPVVALTRHDH